MTKRRIHAEPRRYWTKDEDRELRRRYPHEPTADIARDLKRGISAVYQRAITRGMRKTAAYLASPAAHRLDGVKGMGTRFQPGHQSWNKGTHWTAGGRSKLTRFKKGNWSKRWDMEAYALGALRITTDGYLLIKATPERSRHSWKLMARYVWETERGQIPPDHVIRFSNGDPHDTRIENLELITRAEHLARNWHRRYPLELRRLVQLRGALQRQINKREGKHEQHNQRPA